MKRTFLKMIASAALLLSVAAPAIAQEAPDALIRRLSTEVLDRMPSHISALVPSAPSRRSAIAALTPARPFRTAERA